MKASDMVKRLQSLIDRDGDFDILTMDEELDLNEYEETCNIVGNEIEPGYIHMELGILPIKYRAEFPNLGIISNGFGN